MNKLYPISVIKPTFFSNQSVALLLLLLFAFPSAKTFAQQKKEYTLLWRISGNGLQQPSYLFGTMHVKDKRVFGFSDSVMLAIQKSSAFALEVHPDTIIKKMFITLQSRDTSRNLRSLLGKEDYDKLARRFEKKNGFPMGDIDPIQAESMIQPEAEKADDRQTFVDAYLYGVARSLSKSIYGLENASEQFDGYYGLKNTELKNRLSGMLRDDYEEAQLENVEDLTKVYSTGNMDSILSYLSTEQLNDPVLIARNKVMVKSMLACMASQTLFTAVGVAHLPGDNGIIALLRAAGYTVTNVAANFTGVAAKFNTDLSKLKWQSFTDEERGYTMEFPFKPLQTNVMMGMNTVIYPDMANDLFFGSYAVLEGSGSNPANEQKVIDATIKRFKAKGINQVISIKHPVINGLKATDIIVKSGPKQGSRYMLFFTNNMLYCLYAGNRLAVLNEPYANRFFNSFKAFRVAPAANKSWITLKNDTAAFSINLPGKPQSFEKLVSAKQGSSIKLKMYMAIDTVNFENYLVRYSNYAAGSYVENAENSFDAIVEEYKTNGIQILSSKKISKDGIPGRDITMIIKKVNCRAQLFCRGNRIYILLKQNLREGTALRQADDFFGSFTFIPYIKSLPVDYDIDPGNFRNKTFTGIKTLNDSTPVYKTFFNASQTVFTTNELTGGLYGTEHAVIKKYYRAKNVDSVYKAIIPYMVNYQDSLVKTDTILVNGIAGREYITQVKTSGLKKRFRIFIDDGDLFFITSYLAQEEIFSDESNTYYNGLVKIRNTAHIDLATSKAELIMTDLSSSDTLVHKKALGALNYYKFSKEELPDVYNALQKNYRDDTLETGTKARLIELLATVNDEKTPGELQKVYLATGATDAVKAGVLSTIAKADTIDGHNKYLELLTTGTPVKSDILFQVFTPLSDSLGFVAANLPRILPLMKDLSYRKNLLRIFNSMAANTKGKYSAVINTHFNEISRYATADLNNYIAERDSSFGSYYMPVYYYLNMMKNVTGQQIAGNFTSRIIAKDKIVNLVTDAIITRLKNKLPVQQAIINQVLDSLNLRYDLMEALEKQKQLNRVPLKYRTPSEFAKISLMKYTADEDEGSAERVTLLGTIPEKGLTYYVFGFTTSYDDTAKYIGICGPYKAGAATLDFKHYKAYTNWKTRQVNWRKQAKEMIPALKEQSKNQTD